MCPSLDASPGESPSRNQGPDPSPGWSLGLGRGRCKGQGQGRSPDLILDRSPDTDSHPVSGPDPDLAFSATAERLVELYARTRQIDRQTETERKSHLGLLWEQFVNAGHVVLWRSRLVTV